MPLMKYATVQDLELDAEKNRRDLRLYLSEVEMGNETPDAFALQLITDALTEAEKSIALLKLSEEFLVDCD